VHDGGAGHFLRQGYFAAIMAQDNEFKDSDLRIVHDSLRILADEGRGAPQELRGYNYMLFRIERRTHQDWKSLSNIKELVERAQSAIETKQHDIARDLLTSIKIAVFRNPDVAKADRAGMFARIREHLRELGLEAAVAGGPGNRSIRLCSARCLCWRPRPVRS
jgi:hypothetical protein